MICPWGSPSPAGFQISIAPRTEKVACTPGCETCAILFHPDCGANMQEIVIADDQEMYRTGVAEVLAGNREFQVVSQSSDWKSLLSALAINRGALVITSVSLVADFQHLATRAALGYGRVLLVTEDADSLPLGASCGPAEIIQRSASPVALIETLRRMQTGAASTVTIQ
jgi:DNA-binding NarL/FixJ family response regulator